MVSIATLSERVCPLISDNWSVAQRAKIALSYGQCVDLGVVLLAKQLVMTFLPPFLFCSSV